MIKADDMNPPSCAPVLMTGEIHVWQRHLMPSATQLERLHALLSPEEHQRAQHLHHNQRVAFVTTRGTLRLLLGHYLGLPPATLCFCYQPHGKPKLANPSLPLCFNVSHSGQWSLYALAMKTEVGIDLQEMRPAPPQHRLDLAHRFFSATEHTALSRLPTPEVHAAFFACWTRKEACIKCHGTGLATTLAQFIVDTNPAPHHQTITLPEAGQPSYQCHDLPAPHGYHAALATTPIPHTTLRYFQWPATTEMDDRRYLDGVNWLDSAYWQSVWPV